jgi:hypothetical protein
MFKVGDKVKRNDNDKIVVIEDVRPKRNPYYYVVTEVISETVTIQLFNQLSVIDFKLTAQQGA